MPTNLYGPYDTYHETYSHVIPAMILKFHQARHQDASSVVLWGTGRPLREFLHVDDLASACLFLIKREVPYDLINVGVGYDISIQELSEKIAKIVGYTGKIEFDPSHPDGTPKKLLDISRLQNLGWSASIDLTQGLQETYQNFLQGKAR